MIMEFTFYPFEEKYVSKVEKRWGVYKLADNLKKVVFIGRGNVQKHLPKHLPGGNAPAEDAVYFSVEYFDTGEEAYEAWESQLKSFQKRYGKSPIYNKSLD
ncbi:MAG: hypothetical protein ACMUIE_01840 [Thermoplasmatota archaeon]